MQQETDQTSDSISQNTMPHALPENASDPSENGDSVRRRGLLAALVCVQCFTVVCVVLLGMNGAKWDPLTIPVLTVAAVFAGYYLLMGLILMIRRSIVIPLITSLPNGIRMANLLKRSSPTDWRPSEDTRRNSTTRSEWLNGFAESRPLLTRTLSQDFELTSSLDDSEPERTAPKEL